MKKLIFLFFCGCILFSCSAINKKLGLPDDHPLEEWTEEQINIQFGIDIDLTPSSPETPR